MDGTGDPAPEQSVQVSISQTFYEQLFRAKVFCSDFIYLQFRFVIFLRKEYQRKSCS